MVSPLLITPPTACTASWWTKPACGAAQIDPLELVLSRRDPLLELSNLALRVAQILQRLGPEILVELDDLQLDLADLAARARDVGDERATFALQPRLVSLKLHIGEMVTRFFL
jgi:hypothetical protein